MMNKFITLLIFFILINSVIVLSDDTGEPSEIQPLPSIGTNTFPTIETRNRFRDSLSEPSDMSVGDYSLDFINSLFRQTAGSRMITSWLDQRSWMPDWDITKSLGINPDSGMWPYIFDTTYAITNKWLCNNKREGYFEESVYREATRSGTLPLSTDNMIYVYGLKQKYEDSNGNSLAGLEKSWFINEENEPIGYLYTISWQFRNPYTSSDIEEMSSSDRNSKGLDSSGNLSLAIVLSNSQTSKQGMERKVSPSRSSGGTVSFYSLDDFDKVHIKFLNNYEHNGRNTFPNPNECRDNNIGCIKEIHFEGSMYGSIVNPEEFTSMATAQITEGDVASADSDTQEDCGDLGCVI